MGWFDKFWVVKMMTTGMTNGYFQAKVMTTMKAFRTVMRRVQKSLKSIYGVRINKSVT